MHGHKLTLRIKSRPPKAEHTLQLPDGGSVDTPPPVDVELLIDGKKAALVQSFTVGLDAESLVPVVFLKLIPGELDIEIDSPAAFHAAFAEYKRGFLHGIDGSFAPNPAHVPIQSGEPAPLPPLTPAEASRLEAEWNRQFNDGTFTAEQQAAMLKDQPVLAPSDIFGRPPGRFVSPLGGTALVGNLTESERAELMRNGWNEQPMPTRTDWDEALKGATCPKAGSGSGGDECCGEPAACKAGPQPVPGDKVALYQSAFEVLDRLVGQGAHSQPIVLRVQDGKVVTGTLDEYDRKAKDPLPKVG